MTDTRTRILDACWKLLEDPETPTISLEAVGAAAGVSRQSVYLHFGNRATLIVATIEHAKRELGLEAAGERLRAAGSADEALAILLEVHVDVMPRTLRASRRVAAERERDPALEAAWKARDASRLAVVRGVVERFAAEGRIAPGWTVAEATDLLWALTAPALTDDLLEQRGWSRRRLGERLHELIGAAFTPGGTHATRPRRDRKRPAAAPRGRVERR